MKAAEVYDQVTATIVAELEAGASAASWRAPWTSSTTFPKNASTGRSYQGGNVVVLWVTQIERAYPTEWWATYKQWQSLGAQVRKGERGTYGIKWVTAANARRKADDEDVKRSAFPSGFVLFNAAQVDGWTPPVAEVRDAPTAIAEAEAFFAAVGATVVAGEPAYSPVQDVILMPALAQFNDAESYYATSAHEHTHWTGHKSRLDRQVANRFGTEAYAAEELVAELGAAFLSAHLGITNVVRPDHAQYIASWIKLLKHDSKAVFTAASLAEKAVDYLVERAQVAAVAA